MCQRRLFTALCLVPGVQNSPINMCWNECMNAIASLSIVPGTRYRSLSLHICRRRLVNFSTCESGEVVGAHSGSKIRLNADILGPMGPR